MDRFPFSWFFCISFSFGASVDQSRGLNLGEAVSDLNMGGGGNVQTEKPTQMRAHMLGRTADKGKDPSISYNWIHIICSSEAYTNLISISDMSCYACIHNYVFDGGRRISSFLSFFFCYVNRGKTCVFDRTPATPPPTPDHRSWRDAWRF